MNICDDCGGDGWTAEHESPSLHTEDGECMGYCPIQVQCEKCQGTGKI